MKIVSPLYMTAFNITDGFKKIGLESRGYGWCVLGEKGKIYRKCGNFFDLNGIKYSVELWNDDTITIEKDLKVIFRFPKPSS